MSRVMLNVADIHECSGVNGPGLRSVVWVQGCTLNCPGCLNAHTHPHKPVRLVDPSQLGLRLAGLPRTTGLTISGGEPFQQATACAELAESYRASGRSVMAYSGYQLGVLSASQEPAVRRLLAQIDLLIAGPYVRELHCSGETWRGSTNQTVHVLTERLKDIAVLAPSNAVVEIESDGHQIACTGFPHPEDLAWIKALAHRSEADGAGAPEVLSH